MFSGGVCNLPAMDLSITLCSNFCCLDQIPKEEQLYKEMVYLDSVRGTTARLCWRRNAGRSHMTSGIRKQRDMNVWYSPSSLFCFNSQTCPMNDTIHIQSESSIIRKACLETLS